MIGEYKVILAAVDGSDQSKLAFEHAIKIAKRNEAKLILAFAVGDNNVYLNNTYREGLKKQLTNRANEILEELEVLAKDAGLTDIDKLIAYGIPKDIIANEFVDDHNVELIVMGASGMNAASKFIMGSTSEYVIRHAKCHVLIVK